MSDRFCRIGGRAAVLFSAVLIMGTLVSVSQTAKAATATRLSGAFNVVQLVTAAQNGDPVGYSQTLPYTFVPSCGSGPCATQMTRRHNDGTNLTYTVNPDSAGDYVGNSTYVGSCYRNSAPVVQAGETYTETIKITPTASSGGNVSAFTGTLSLSFVPTASGTANGCSGGSETLQLTGALPTTVRTVVAPSYTVVRYVHNIAFLDCYGDLREAKISNASVLCAFLDNSANGYPPSNLGGAALQRFIQGKDYRGYTNLPSYTVTCTNGQVTAENTTPGSSPFSWSLGYTRIKGPHGSLRELAEPYTSDNNYDRTSPTIALSADHSSVSISYDAASRIALGERVGNYGLSGYDAPFIWDNITETIGCDGTQLTTVENTVFPTTDIYVDGAEVRYEKQSSDIASFIKEGGTVLNPVGYGNLAYPCHVAVFSGAVLDNAYDSCANG